MNVSRERTDSIEAEVDRRMALRHPAKATTTWIKSTLGSVYNSHTIWSCLLVCLHILILGSTVYPFTMLVQWSLNGNSSLWEQWPNETRFNTTVELYVNTPGSLMILLSINILLQSIAIVSQIISLWSLGQRCVNLSHIGCISVALCQFILISLHYYYTKENPFTNVFMIILFIVAIVYLVHFFPRLMMIPVGFILFIIAALTIPGWIWPVCFCLCCCKYCNKPDKTRRPDYIETTYWKEVDRYGFTRRKWAEDHTVYRNETKEEKRARKMEKINKKLEEREQIRNQIIKKREERGRNEIELNVMG